MLNRWIAVLAGLVLFATGADALILGRNLGTVSGAGGGGGGGGGGSTSLAVYPGCTLPPPTPTGFYGNAKTWYFDVANGHPPGYYDNPVGAITAAGSGGPSTTTVYSNVTITSSGSATAAKANIVVSGGGVITVNPTTDWNGLGFTAGQTLSAASASIGGTTGFSFVYQVPVPEAQWGDVTHPFDVPDAIWNQPSIDLDYYGWGANAYPYPPNNLHVLALFAPYRTTVNLVLQDSTNYASPATDDPNHFRLWPGDAAYLRGDPAGDSFGNFGLSPGAGGGFISNNDVDGSGATKWVWITKDPSYPTPLFSQTSSNAVQGVIFQNFEENYHTDFTALTTAGLGAYVNGTGGPTGFANNAVHNVPLTGGSGNGATAVLTFSTTGAVQSLSIENGGTGYKNGDVVGVGQNTGNPTLHAPLGVGNLSASFALTITAPNTTKAAHGMAFNNLNGLPVSGTNFITAGVDQAGTLKTYWFGSGGVNIIPQASPNSLQDVISNTITAMMSDSQISAVETWAQVGTTGVTWAKAGGGGTVSLPLGSYSQAINPIAGATIVFDAITYTFVNGSSSGTNIAIGTSISATQANIIAQIKANDAAITSASASNATSIQITAVQPGVQGVLHLSSNLNYNSLDTNGQPIPALLLSNQSSTNVIASIGPGHYGLMGQKAANHSYVMSGVSPPSNINTPIGALNFAAGQTFSFDGITYHWAATSSGANVAVGATMQASLNNAAAQIMVNDTSMTGVTGGYFGATHDVILDGAKIGSWGQGHAYTPVGSLGWPANDYPSTGSLGIDPNTGGVWPHPWWNHLDWAMQTAFGGMNIIGSRDPESASNEPIIGVSCVALTNSYVHHTSTVALAQVYDSLVQNVNQNYNVNDAYDSFNTHDVTWDGVSTFNAVNPLNGVHPDGLQFGIEAINFDIGIWSNNKVINSTFVDDIDPFLADPSLQVVGLDGLTYDATQDQSGINDTQLALDSAYIANNTFYSQHPEAFYFPAVQNSTFVNNSLLYRGNPATVFQGSGTFQINIIPNATVSQTGNVLANNVGAGFGVGYAAIIQHVGSGGTPGVYPGVAFTSSGLGSGVIATVTVGSSGSVTQVNITNGGTGLAQNTTQTPTPATTPPGLTGFTLINPNGLELSSLPLGPQIPGGIACEVTMMNNILVPSYFNGTLNAASFGKGQVCNTTNSPNTGPGANGLSNAASESQPLTQIRVGPIVGGSGGTPGTYTAVPLSGGAGSGATANIVVGSGGAVTSVQIASPGAGYLGGDIMTAAPGGVSGFQFPVYAQFANAGLTVWTSGLIIGNVGSGGTPGTYPGVTFNSSGTGSGLVATVTIGANGSVSQVNPTSAGSGYATNTVQTPVTAPGGVVGFNLVAPASTFPLGPQAPTNMRNVFQAYTPCSNPPICTLISSSNLDAQPPGYPAAPTGPLIGAGTSSFALTTNHDRRPWPLGTPNIGAY